MIQVDSCIICGGPFARQRRGVVTPFLAHRVWQRKPFRVAFSECSDCGFQFFNPRMEPADEGRLYSGYRSAEYQKMRHSFEPWYTEKLNASLSSAGAWLHRKRLLRSLFTDKLHLDGRSFGNVLDFGGDRGDLITDLVPAKRRFVYEISGVEPVEGVERLRSMEECRQHSFDLIITSNVLEHVGSPREIMAQIDSISHPGTLVFHEAPFESVTDLPTRLKRIAQAGWLMAARPTVAWSVIGPAMLCVMHEHVNYFTPGSLDRLMQVSGFDVVASGDYAASEGFMGQRVAWVLAQKPGTAGN